MPLYTEHWSARPAWLALSLDERIRYLDQLGPAIDRLVASGVTLLGVVLRESRLLHRSDCHYLAVWHMPAGVSQAHMLESALAAAGWEVYFEPATAAPDVWETPDALGTPEAPTPSRRATRELRRVPTNGRRD
jgi:hypothetical protein